MYRRGVYGWWSLQKRKEAISLGESGEIEKVCGLKRRSGRWGGAPAGAS
jgi:hypothetical protein